ncbi:hypothetical protein [Stigmatella aurantiaca]|uniref:Conserved uncharacterized protein n=1 Tax=Stigmatella aurantiaca (strain DW4/3-1) TaxID=378806 RepID=E3FLM9_STIAD|nr:hypothetical protein [Stigmatella aurantiaca]ADO74293.1 conserved uncharacterized protein [Stigmatella aurantiaca DW4/3-1]
MEGLFQALKAYQTFNPQGWVGIYRLLPMWLGIVCCAIGLGLLLFGGGGAFRAVAGPVGGLIGLLWTSTVTTKLGLPELTPRLPSFVAAVLSLLGFVFPEAIVFLGVGIPLGLLAGQLAGRNDFLLGFVPVLLITGLVGAILHRVVATVVASAVGAWLLVIGALAALNQFGGLVTAVANQPWGVIIAAGLFALAGSVYQLAVRPSPEEAERLRAERERLKLRKAEEKALEKRWGAK